MKPINFKLEPTALKNFILPEKGIEKFSKMHITELMPEGDRLRMVNMKEYYLLVLFKEGHIKSSYYREGRNYILMPRKEGDNRTLGEIVTSDEVFLVILMKKVSFWEREFDDFYDDTPRSYVSLLLFTDHKVGGEL